ncbi:putative transmembrane protein [Nocardia nova SH22a]|uniref:Putative transmembrane protein n=1 Tax=Nocardia nova SH22a TaxID=1415166 RepID=W5TL20_9NOCA|nr:hypothetical protein [Nocardia nova]AHH20055.1 putative transmembrane protein [Nocardia nova SH22a]
MTSSQHYSRARRTPAALLIISAVTIWIALFGPVWTYLPATTTTPATTLTFADLTAASAFSPDGLQAAFYQWIAWLFAALTTATVIVALRSRRKTAGIACALVGTLQLLFTIFVNVSAAPQMSALLSALPYTRLGTILFLGSMVALIIAGAQLLLRPEPTVDPSSA